MNLPEKIHDFFMRFPAVGMNLYFLIFEILNLRTLIGRHPYWGDSADFILSLLARVALIMFLGLIAWLHFIRRRPVMKHANWRPKIEAFMGATFLYLLLLLPRGEANIWFDGVSSLLLIVGNIVCLIALLDLGRSISIMPEARRLVTEGLYRLVRHPLYLGEGIALLGVMLQFRSLAALAIVAFGFWLQVRRMHWEEIILGEAFSEYREYAGRTARLIPGVY